MASIVGISEVPMLSIGVTQERVGAPSTCTVQAPQSAMPQPNFVPVMPSTSRNTHKRGVSPSTSTVRSAPLTLIVMAMVISRLTWASEVLDRTRCLGWRPFGGPAASGTIHLVARVLRKLHDEAVAAQP